MSKIITSKLKIFKRFKVDIWGDFFFNRRKRRINVFMLKMLALLYRRRRKRYSILFQNLISKFEIVFVNELSLSYLKRIRKESFLLNYYYSKLGGRQLKKILNYSKELNSRLENVFFSYLERRLDIFCIRLNLCKTIWSLKQLLKAKFILLNQSFVNSVNQKINIFDFLSILPTKRIIVKRILYNSFTENIFRMYFPLYFEINIKTLTFFFLENFFNVNLIHYPFSSQKSIRSGILKFIKKI